MMDEAPDPQPEEADRRAEAEFSDAARSQLSLMLSGRGVVNRATIRGVVAVLGLLAVLLTNRSADDLGEIAGLVLLAVAVIDAGAWYQYRRDDAGAWLWGRALAEGVGGVLLLAWPGATLEVLDAVVAGFLFVFGATDLLQAALNRSGDRRWSVLRGTLALLVGAFLLLHPSSAFTVVALAIAAMWISVAVIAVAYTVRGIPGDEESTIDPAATWEILLAWLRSHELSPEERSFLNEKLFFEGDLFRQRVFRFTVLMFLSVAIATFGIVLDSTAVVIGAMLIAPLMTPIMATAAALIMGWPRRAARSGLLVAFGVAFAVLVAWAIVQLLPSVRLPVETSQVTSRTSPTTIDLLIALAAGAAGAFAQTRRDVSDSLPGVAVAVALVPPLSVVGISIAGGSWSDAGGAFLLFLTNLVSILLAGALVFVLTGYTPLFRLQQRKSQIRRSIATVAIGAVLVVLPLAAAGQRVAADALAYDEAEAAVEAWLGDSPGFTLDDLEVTGSDVNVVISGSGEPPSAEELAEALASVLSRTVELDLQVVPLRNFEVTAEG